MKNKVHSIESFPIFIKDDLQFLTKNQARLVCLMTGNFTHRKAMSYVDAAKFYDISTDRARQTIMQAAERLMAKTLYGYYKKRPYHQRIKEVPADVLEKGWARPSIPLENCYS